MKRQRKKKNSGKGKENLKLSGFSIIELTIIITIFSFFAVNALVTHDDAKKFSKYSSTNHKLEKIQDAISKYVNIFGHYPCPANGNVPINDPNIGSGNWANPPNRLTTMQSKCGAAGTPGQENGTYNFEGQIAIDDTQHNVLRDYTNVVIGVVPVRELELPTEYMIDSFGNRFTYAVRRELTSPLTFPMSTNADPNPPAIWKDGSPAFGSANNISIDIATEDAGVSWTTNAAYLIISHGANGFGAYPFEQGLSSGALTTRISPPDIEDNPNGDVSGTFSVGELANHHLNCEVDRNDQRCPSNGIDVFDRQFFIPKRPEIAQSNNAIVYDDVVVWGIQESHKLDTTKYPPDSQLSQPMIDYFENIDDGNGKSPDQILGLALWLDAQDCETIFIGGRSGGSSGSDSNACAAKNAKSVRGWYEKGSLFNNYYKGSSGAIIASVARPVEQLDSVFIQPAYDPGGATGKGIGNLPSIIFRQNDTAKSSAMVLNNLPINGAPEEDVSLLPNSLTIFIVGKTNEANGNNHVDKMQTFLARTDFWNSTNPTDSNAGYIIAGLADTGPFNKSEIGVGVNDFSVSGAPNLSSIARFSPTEQNVPHIFVSRFDASTDKLEIYDGCTLENSRNVGTGIIHLPQDSSPLIIGDVTLAGGQERHGALNGAIGEIVMYERALADYERLWVTNYLSAKWGIGPDCGTVTKPDVVNVDCAGKILIGNDSSGGAGACCSNNFHNVGSTPTCCMKAFQAHVEKCKNNNDCCGEAACTAFGYCYDPINVDNPSYL